MEIDATLQIIIAVALGVLTIVWNQQRSAGNLRQEFQEAHKDLQREFHEANEQLRGAVAANGERLARIEGHLGIGVAAPRTGGIQAHTDEPGQTRHAATG